MKSLMDKVTFRNGATINTRIAQTPMLTNSAHHEEATEDTIQYYHASFRIRVWDVPNKHFSGLGGGFPKAKNRKRVLACCACYRFSLTVFLSTNTTILRHENGQIDNKRVIAMHNHC